jgi:hypothetical protein
MTNGLFDRVGNQLLSAVQRLHVKSALNPMLWLCGIAAMAFLPAAYAFKTNTDMCWTLIYTAVGVFATTCIGFLGFALFKPDKLQSEEYQIRHEAMQILQQKDGWCKIDPMTIPHIANPAQSLLESPKGKQKGKPQS